MHYILSKSPKTAQDGSNRARRLKTTGCDSLFLSPMVIMVLSIFVFAIICIICIAFKRHLLKQIMQCQSIFHSEGASHIPRCLGSAAGSHQFLRNSHEVFSPKAPHDLGVHELSPPAQVENVMHFQGDLEELLLHGSRHLGECAVSSAVLVCGFHETIIWSSSDVPPRVFIEDLLDLGVQLQSVGYHLVQPPLLRRPLR